MYLDHGHLATSQSGALKNEFATHNGAFFRAGVNEFVFAVAGDVSELHPTGLEFEGMVQYRISQTAGYPDADGDGVPDDRDECPDTRPSAVTGTSGCAARPKYLVIPVGQ